MIQRARSENSRSLLREAKDCVLLLDSEEKISYFQKLIDDMLEKRNNPDVVYTGAKYLREQLLICLSQLGHIQTANVWARALDVSINSINELREELAKRLSNAGIYGILEVHLQDREINSPHIQFVGTRAEEAEMIIAEFLVEKKYELSIKEAIGKDFIPYYDIEPDAEIQFLDEVLEKVEEEYIDEQREEFNKALKQIQKLKDECLASIQNSFSSIKSSLNDKFARARYEMFKTSSKRNAQPIYNLKNDEIHNSLRDRIRKLRNR